MFIRLSKHLYERQYGSLESEARCPRAGRGHVSARNSAPRLPRCRPDRCATVGREVLRDPAWSMPTVDQPPSRRRIAPEHVAGDELRRHLAWRQDPAMRDPPA